MRVIGKASVPGAYLADLFPFCEMRFSTRTHSRKVDTLIYSEVSKIPAIPKGSG